MLKRMKPGKGKVKMYRYRNEDTGKELVLPLLPKGKQQILFSDLGSCVVTYLGEEK